MKKENIVQTISVVGVLCFIVGHWWSADINTDAYQWIWIPGVLAVIFLVSTLIAVLDLNE